MDHNASEILMKINESAAMAKIAERRLRELGDPSYGSDGRGSLSRGERDMLINQFRGIISAHDELVDRAMAHLDTMCAATEPK